MKKRRRTKREEHKAPKEKDRRKRKGRANILLGEGDDALSDLPNFGSNSGSSVPSLNSVANTDSSSDGSRGRGSGSGSDSGSSGSGGSGSRSDSVSD